MSGGISIWCGARNLPSPAALLAREGELYAALHTNEVKVSRDGGRTWTVRAQP